MPVSRVLYPNGVVFTTSGREDARARDVPDITSMEYWLAACASATAWLVFILYAASRGLD